jgi:hypothetical protein
MKKQELNNKSDTEKKKHVLQGRSTQRGPESSDYKTEEYFQQISAESSPERLLSILTSPELSHPINAFQKLNIINHLQKNYGNSNIQRMIQAKLKIGQPNDKYEQEADRIAEAVMRMPELQVQRRADEGEEEELSQTKGNPVQTSEVEPDVEEGVTSLRGRGQALSESDKAFFKPRFGQDFSDVRIHSNPEASKMARALNAKAVTLCRDIVFGSGQYRPGTTAGRRLLAHELAHVVQQAGGSAQTQRDVNATNDMYEQEADHLARQYTHQGQLGTDTLRKTSISGRQVNGNDRVVPLQAPTQACLVQREVSESVAGEGVEKFVQKIKTEVKKEIPEGFFVAAEIMEGVELVLNVIKVATHWTPLALAGAVLCPLSTLFTMAGSVKMRKHSGMLRGIEMGLKAASFYASTKPECLYPISAKQIEEIVHAHFEVLWVSVSQGGEIAQNGAREGMQSVVKILNDGMEYAEKEVRRNLDECGDIEKSELSPAQIEATIKYIQGYVFKSIIEEGLEQVKTRLAEIQQTLFKE